MKRDFDLVVAQARAADQAGAELEAVVVGKGGQSREHDRDRGDGAKHRGAHAATGAPPAAARAGADLAAPVLPGGDSAIRGVW